MYYYTENKATGVYQLYSPNGIFIDLSKNELGDFQTLQRLPVLAL